MHAILELSRNNAGVAMITITEIGDDGMAFRTSVVKSGYESGDPHEEGFNFKAVDRMVSERFAQLAKYMRDDTVIRYNLTEREV